MAMVFRHVIGMQRASSILLRSQSYGLFVINNLRCISNTKLRGKISVQGVPVPFSGQNGLMHQTHLTTLQVNQQRGFWGVSVAFNQVDPERVRLAGPDRAAAEWILRNGGSIKWKDSQGPLEDYNLLPSTEFDKYKLEEINLTATDVIGIGFQHLEHLKHVKRIKLHGCRTIMDDAIGPLNFVEETLEWLEISRCPMITEKGLEHLHVLKKLKTLVIYDLIELRNFDDSISRLRQAMPWCEIICEDPLSKNQEDDDTNK